MAARTPLVLVGGETQQLQAGDTLSGGGGGMAIGGAVSGGTSGEVLYVDASANLAQSGLMQFSATGGRLGLGGAPFSGATVPASLGGLDVQTARAAAWFRTTGAADDYAQFVFGEGFADGQYVELVRYNNASAAGNFPGSAIFFNSMHDFVLTTSWVAAAPRPDLYIKYNNATNSLVGVGTSDPQGYLDVSGGPLTLSAASSTGANRPQGKISGVWPTSTDASRKGRIVVSACDSTGTDREGLRVESDGAQALVSFYGGSAVAKPSGDVATALSSLGLVTSPTYAASGLTGALTTPVIAAGAAPAAAQGKLNFDSTRNALTVGAGASATPANVPMTGAVSVSTSVVTVNANVTTAQNLMSYSVPAGLLNVAAKALRINAAGVLSVNTTATVTIAVKLGTVTLLTWTSASITGGAGTANSPWNFDAVLATAATGATGTVECHGAWNLKPTTGAGAVTSYIDIGTGPSAALDLTAAQTLQVTVTFSANGTGGNANSCTERLLHCELSN